MNLQSICFNLTDICFIGELINRDLYSFENLPRFYFFKKTFERMQAEEHKFGNRLEDENKSLVAFKLEIENKQKLF